MVLPPLHFAAAAGHEPVGSEGDMTLLEHPGGGYRFLATGPGEPYSGGVVAMPGFEIVHTVLRQPVPVAEAFALVERTLAELARPRTALCAVELRGARPYTPGEWVSPDGFNAHYRKVLRDWGLFVDGLPAVARTNVVPVVRPPSEQVLHAFSYTVPSGAAASAAARSTFVTSGAPEAPSIWTSDATVEVRLLSSLDAIGKNIERLGGRRDDVTAVDVYVREGITVSAATAALERIGGAARHGLHWYLTLTPLLGPYLECDARCVRQEVVL